MLIGALETGGTNMICSIGNQQGGVMQRASFPTTTPENTIPQVIDFFKKFEIKALGIGSFGPLDLHVDSPAYGNITNTPKMDWQDYPLLATLRRALNVPMAIDMAVNTAALAEYRMGAGQGTRSMLYITVGSGIGGGIIIEGKPVHGLVHPEWGHILVAPREGDPMPGGICPYHRNCLEGLASGPAMEKRWGLSPRLMMDDHPAWALEADYLAQICASAIVAISPEKIVLGGGVLRRTFLYDMIRERVLSLLGGYVASPKMTPEGIGSYIVAPALGMNSGVIGALMMGAQALQAQETCKTL